MGTIPSGPTQAVVRTGAEPPLRLRNSWAMAGGVAEELPEADFIQRVSPGTRTRHHKLSLLAVKPGVRCPPKMAERRAAGGTLYRQFKL